MIRNITDQTRDRDGRVVCMRQQPAAAVARSRLKSKLRLDAVGDLVREVILRADTCAKQLATYLDIELPALAKVMIASAGPREIFMLYGRSIWTQMPKLA